MELSKRLQAVTDLLDEHECIADIGCDHGFVSIYLIENKKAKKCLAMDVNEGPLERAKEHILQKRLSTYRETRLSDGAKALRYIEEEGNFSKLEVEAALIAGMGGKLMVKIMQDSLDKFQSMEEFVLQPQSEIAKVRQFVREMGYTIKKENMILEDGKFYPMMKAVKGTSVFENTALQQELFDEYGEYLLKNRNPVLLEFLLKEKAMYEEILTNLEKQESIKAEERRKEILAKLEMIKAVKRHKNTPVIYYGGRYI